LKAAVVNQSQKLTLTSTDTKLTHWNTSARLPVPCRL